MKNDENKVKKCRLTKYENIFQISGKSNTEVYFYINLQLRKTRNGINAWKSNMIKTHWSSKLPIKHLLSWQTYLNYLLHNLMFNFYKCIEKWKLYREMKNLSNVRWMLSSLIDWMLIVETRKWVERVCESKSGMRKEKSLMRIWLKTRPKVCLYRDAFMYFLS